MLNRTHLAIAIFVSLLLMNYFDFSYVFVLGILIATFIPDLDSYNSKFGKRFISRVLTSFSKHRGIMHSLFFALIFGGILFWLTGEFGLGFFIGYFLHLVVDCFTKQGIKMFWPFEFKIKGFIKSGGRIESFVFLSFILLDFFLLFSKIFSMV
ncbi:metal-dependent hydrolase [Candidatus Pacearchaeota archaeon]|nr:metal-dependent hydrolase [Candidatus Pacearchaeota archaeon]